MNEQAASAAVAQAREAKANKLWASLLGLFTVGEVSDLRYAARPGNDDNFYKELRAFSIRVYDAGYDDGFAEGEAVANEPDRNEGYA